MTIDRIVHEYLAHLTVERGLADNTLRSYRRDLGRYRAFLADAGRSEVAEIVEADLAAFTAHLRTGDEEHPALGASSVARTVVAVRGFHRFLVREGLVERDVTETLKPPRPAARLPKALPLEDVEAIITAAGEPGTTLAHRDSALLELLYGSGARISEAVGLDVGDIDLETGTILVMGKGSRQRVVPIGSYAIDALTRYLHGARRELLAPGRSTPAVFLNARGGRLSRQSAWTVLNRAAERAGITADVSPHTFRHSFATHLLDGGADVRVVQELLGHASVATTEIYTKVTADKLREVFATAHPRSHR